jgi:myb proto-oncogene protein
MVRGPFYDKNGLKKGAWTPEEDYKLKCFIQTHGHSNWCKLPRRAGKKHYIIFKLLSF